MKKVIKLKESDLMNIIKRVIREQETTEVRHNYEDMSDDGFHPEVATHKDHFKDYKPTSEYLGWKGEVSKRNMYKRNGKFHNAFDKKKED